MDCSEPDSQNRRSLIDPRLGSVGPTPDNPDPRCATCGKKFDGGIGSNGYRDTYDECYGHFGTVSILDMLNKQTNTTKDIACVPWKNNGKGCGVMECTVCEGYTGSIPGRGIIDPRLGSVASIITECIPNLYTHGGSACGLEGCESCIRYRYNNYANYRYRSYSKNKSDWTLSDIHRRQTINELLEQNKNYDNALPI